MCYLIIGIVLLVILVLRPRRQRPDGMVWTLDGGDVGRETNTPR